MVAKKDKSESDKLLGLRYEYKLEGRPFSDDFKGLHIVAKSNISLYLSPKWLAIGIILFFGGGNDYHSFLVLRLNTSVRISCSCSWVFNNSFSNSEFKAKTEGTFKRN